MIQSVKRVSDILSLFTIEKQSRGITEISKIIGLPKSTVSSLVKTMSEVGFLEQDTETKRYRLGPKLFTLGILVS
ncbi:MAG: helix-turn-helix domain-containing protein, partial [Deltaproteobacteria bacterium]|nr:helix-turn-helix domain-containing protein [Deltaproteobacteria bacterium]